jgi:hypothetical protein
LPQITLDQATQPHVQAPATITESKHCQATIPPSQGVTTSDNATHPTHPIAMHVCTIKYLVYYTLLKTCVLTSLHYPLTKNLDSISAKLHVQVHQSHLRTTAHNQKTGRLRTKKIEEQYYCYRTLITDVRFGTKDRSGHSPPTTTHTTCATQYQVHSSFSPPTTLKEPETPASNLQQDHAVYCSLSTGQAGRQQRSAPRTCSNFNKLWTYRHTYTCPPTRKLLPSNHLTLSLFIKNCCIKNKIEKSTLYKRLHEIGSFILFRTSTTKTSSTLSPQINVVVVQKQFHEPHKALNLKGGGRGKRNSPIQHNQCHLQKLTKIKETKQYKLSSTT